MGTFFTKKNTPKSQSGRPLIKFELFGQWDKTLSVMKNLGRDVKESSIKAQMKVGKEIIKRIKGHIRNQDLGWRPLSNKYMQKKQAAGLSGGTLIGYKTYYDNLKVWQSGNRRYVNIGVKRGIYTKETNGKSSKLEVAMIAAVHEFSSGKRIPKRPLWNPTIAEIGGAQGIKRMFTNSLIWHLRAKGIDVSKTGKTGNSLNIGGSKYKLF